MSTSEPLWMSPTIMHWCSEYWDVLIECENRKRREFEDGAAFIDGSSVLEAVSDHFVTSMQDFSGDARFTRTRVELTTSRSVKLQLNKSPGLKQNELNELRSTTEIVLKPQRRIRDIFRPVCLFSPPLLYIKF